MSPMNLFLVDENDAVAQYGIIRALDDIVDRVMRAHYTDSRDSAAFSEPKSRKTAAAA